MASTGPYVMCPSLPIRTLTGTHQGGVDLGGGITMAFTLNVREDMVILSEQAHE